MRWAIIAFFVLIFACAGCCTAYPVTDGRFWRPCPVVTTDASARAEAAAETVADAAQSIDRHGNEALQGVNKVRTILVRLWDFLLVAAKTQEEPKASVLRAKAAEAEEAVAILDKAAEHIAATKEAARPLVKAAETVKEAVGESAQRIQELETALADAKDDSHQTARLWLTIVGAALIAAGVALAWFTKSLWLGGGCAAAGVALIVVTWAIALAAAHPVITGLVGMGLFLAVLVFAAWKMGLLDKALSRTVAGIDSFKQKNPDQKAALNAALVAEQTKTPVQDLVDAKRDST